MIELLREFSDSKEIWSAIGPVRSVMGGSAIFSAGTPVRNFSWPRTIPIVTPWHDCCAVRVSNNIDATCHQRTRNVPTTLESCKLLRPNDLRGFSHLWHGPCMLFGCRRNASRRCGSDTHGGHVGCSRRVFGRTYERLPPR